MNEATKHTADTTRRERASKPSERRHTSCRRPAGRRTAALILGIGLSALASCGGGSSATGDATSQPAPLGAAAVKPGKTGFLEGNAFIVEENKGGEAPDFRIIEMAWGRLVDIYDTKLKPGVTQAEYNLDPLNEELFDSREVYSDFVIGEDVRTAFELGVLKWELSSNAVTGESRLRINFNAEVDKTFFAVRLAQATDGLKSIDPKGFAITELPPYTVMARNAALTVRFDDLIDEKTVGLHSTVKVFAGDPPTVPFDARVLPDPNYGGVAGGIFRSTRLVIDFTISQDELTSIPQVVQANGIGLPPSENTQFANVAIGFPTVVDTAVGQFAVMRNVSGGKLNTNDSGPVDFDSPTLDITWGIRSGSPVDENNGFLIDLEQPRLIGVQPVVITAVNFPDPLSLTNEDLILTVEFDVDECAVDPTPGDVLQLSDVLRVEVLEPSTAVSGTAANIKVNVPSDAPASFLEDLAVQDPGLLPTVLGAAQYLTPWRSSLGASKAPCFVRFAPAAGQLPTSLVDPNADVIVRFSEPIDPDTARPFDTVYVAVDPSIDASLTEDAGVLKAPRPDQLILGSVIPSPDFRQARFAPSVPFEHFEGTTESYFFNIISDLERGGVTDLAGNVLLEPLPRVEFQVDPSAPTYDTGGWVLRFNTTNEDGQPGPEVRGQILFDSTDGSLRPRPVQHFAAVVDRSQPTVGVMQAIPTGLQTPLSSQGSKAHLTWRYMDAGFEISQVDDLFYNVDVEGLALSPLGGQVVATAYDEFEIILGHAKNLPDEIIDTGNLLPKFPSSGFGNNASFADNYLPDPLAGPMTVHPRELGYTVNSSDVFVSSTGTPMLQMPWNQDIDVDDKTYFTWRNTAVQTYGNLNGTSLVGGGAPTEQEVGVVGLSDAPGDAFGKGFTSTVPSPTGIPAPGLPLLIEYRCYPSEEASLNNFDVSIAVTSSPRPFMRAFSTGGTNTGGNIVNKDPDLQSDPTGGFNGNPLLGAIGAPTAPRDPTVYMGQMDLVTRISRAYTVLVDAEQNPTTGTGVAPYEYVAAVIEPAPGDQPNGTSLTLAWRGDPVALLPGTSAMLDASKLDVFGEPIVGPLSDDSGPLYDQFGWVDPSWKDSLSGVSGQRFVQTRITFISNSASELSPTLNSYGLAFYRSPAP